MTNQPITKDFLCLNEATLEYSIVTAESREQHGTGLWYVKSMGSTLTVGYQLFEHLVDLQSRALEIFTRHQQTFNTIQRNLNKINHDVQ